MKTSSLGVLKTGMAALAFMAGSAALSTTASADSCWNHNGSVMRLVAQGNNRWFYYENPKQVLRRAGVRQGTLLFNGRKQGNFYSGTARRFSKYCPGEALEYYVEGPARRDQLKVTVEGQREVYKQCRQTGRQAWDRLVFTYMYKC